MAERGSDEGNIKIILCGETGAGKSTLSNTLLGRREFDSKRSREPVTTEVQKSDFCWWTKTVQYFCMRYTWMP